MIDAARDTPMTQAFAECRRGRGVRSTLGVVLRTAALRQL
jgi:hypothetical protein